VLKFSDIKSVISFDGFYQRKAVFGKKTSAFVCCDLCRNRQSRESILSLFQQKVFPSCRVSFCSSATITRFDRYRNRKQAMLSPMFLEDNFFKRYLSSERQSDADISL
jgi:hypothetical protein